MPDPERDAPVLAVSSKGYVVCERHGQAAHEGTQHTAEPDNQMTLNVTARAATTLLLLFFVACGDATAPDEIAPTQTTVTLRVVSPHQDDGAVFVDLAGPIQSVTAAPGTTLYVERSGNVTRVLALRDAAGGAEWFTMVVPPGAVKPAAIVLAAANLQDLPRDVSAYKVEY